MVKAGERNEPSDSYAQQIGRQFDDDFSLKLRLMLIHPKRKKKKSFNCWFQRSSKFAIIHQVPVEKKENVLRRVAMHFNWTSVGNSTSR